MQRYKLAYSAIRDHPAILCCHVLPILMFFFSSTSIMLSFLLSSDKIYLLYILPVSIISPTFIASNFLVTYALHLIRHRPRSVSVSRPIVLIPSRQCRDDRLNFECFGEKAFFFPFAPLTCFNFPTK